MLNTVGRVEPFDPSVLASREKTVIGKKRRGGDLDTKMEKRDSNAHPKRKPDRVRIFRDRHAECTKRPSERSEMFQQMAYKAH